MRSCEVDHSTVKCNCASGVGSQAAHVKQMASSVITASHLQLLQVTAEPFTQHTETVCHYCLQLFDSTIQSMNILFL